MEFLGHSGLMKLQRSRTLNDHIRPTGLTSSAQECTRSVTLQLGHHWTDSEKQNYDHNEYTLCALHPKSQPTI
ncbi:hypothetical protein IAQ61_006923 [Plenodomus lingam]|uniref:uncharacterized protein n=1 Tax=Leptosphaeria maculans TaxID=5022 RepID=UPI00331734E3|nr:hypothetical protein IAQ61_006923 [Plenodomus lingam]